MCALHVRVRFQIISNEIIKNVGKSESCMHGFLITDYMEIHPYMFLYIEQCENMHVQL